LTAYANSFEETKEVGAGNIAVVVGFHHTSTGDTILSSKEGKKFLSSSLSLNLPTLLTFLLFSFQRYVLEGMKIPPPVFSRAVEASSPAQEKALEEALRILKLEDPSFHYSVDPETQQVSTPSSQKQKSKENHQSLSKI